MKGHVKLFIFLFFILIVGPKLNAKEAKKSDYLKYVHEIVDDFVKQMGKKHQLYCYGSGGSMPTDVQTIEVLFISYKKSTVEDARKMEVDAIEELLKRINAHTKIRPYLREYPFGPDRVDVSISFRTESDDYPLDGSVAFVSLGRNKIYYKSAEIRVQKPIPLSYVNEKNEAVTTLIEGGPVEELVPLMEEPYEEALKKLGRKA